MITAFILYMRPMLAATQRAAEVSELAAKDMRRTSEEMDKTASMLREDIPLTMQEVQRAAEEWELVGKQFNFLVASVVRFFFGEFIYTSFTIKNGEKIPLIFALNYEYNNNITPVYYFVSFSINFPSLYSLVCRLDH